jgi:hypothetical protein
MNPTLVPIFPTYLRRRLGLLVVSILAMLSSIPSIAQPPLITKEQSPQAPTPRSSPAVQTSPTTQSPPALQPPTTPSPTAEPAKFVRYSDTGVYHVKNETRRSANPEADACVARRGDAITIYVKHLHSWLKDPLVTEHLPNNAKISDLVPFLDDVPLKGIHAEESFDGFVDEETGDPVYAEEEGDKISRVHYLRFTLRRTETSKDAWTQVLNRPNFSRPMKVSVGFENGEQITTYVLPGRESDNTFIFTVIPAFSFWLGVVIIVGAFLIFIYLARWTDIIRDTDAPLRPDKRWPYSLSRTQMAFWFFLVIGAFFFLWVILGDTDTLNPSVLGLIGISAGTALGAAFANSAKPAAAASESDLPAVNLSQPRRKIRIEMGKLIVAAKEELKTLETARGKIDPAETDKLAANADAQTKKTQQITDLERQLDYFQWPAWKGVMYDLLSENNVIVFHRFQIFVWTIVLGIMFVANVYNQLAMPQFSATLLGLLGISAGTYVGFKIPEANKTKATD